MLTIFSLVLTCLALVSIPCLFISLRLKVPLSLTNVLRIIKLTARKYHNEEERNEKCGPKEEKEKEKRARNGLPKHVAVIMDGNRRWAKKRGLGAPEGHEAGGRRLIEKATICFAMGVNTISFFAFSTENWGRPEDEVNYLMDLFETQLKFQLPCLQSNKIKFSVIGNRSRIPESLVNVIEEVEEATKSYEEKHLIFAIDYSGRYDILQACKSLAKKAKDGLIEVEDIDEKAIDKEMMTTCSKFPNPDMLIRTSGENRISNFFLWQSAYTELYFPTALWPDFGSDDYIEALTWYQQRERPFGRRV